MDPTIERLYREAMDADTAFSKELERVYGKQAGDRRYDGEAKHTERGHHEVVRLGRESRDACDRYLEVIRAKRQEQH